MWDVLAPFLLILCGVLAGACGGALANWTLLRFLRDLEYRVVDLEERVVREVKIRAAKASADKREDSDKLKLWAEEQMAGSKQPDQLNLTDWRTKKMRG